ncbi:GNAT family N-acetyltransferase [soil metagenome]
MKSVIDHIVRTDALNKDFISLVKLLDQELLQRYGDQQTFFNQFNKTDTLKYVVVAYRDNIPSGCGAIRTYEPNVAEVKRMFVKPEYRSAGIASTVLRELENWARALEFSSCILETGTLQPEAVRLYLKNGFEIIPNYGHYAMVERCICMKKVIL